MHHHPGQMSSELGFLPSMYPFPCLSSMAQTSGFNISSGSSAHLLPQTPANTSWERRCLRKHRRRSDDEACSAKRRRLMLRSDPGDASSMCHSWSPGSPGSPGPVCPLPGPPSPALAPAAPPPLLLQGLAGPPRPLPRQEADCLHMEVEAAQRRLQEIEERITLEDDDEEDDLDVDSTPRRPVLVMSDSLKEGLQRGITDILPHTVAQSVSHSCMELVVWRPPEDALSRKFRGSLQRQRKQQQQAAGRPPPAPSPPGPLPPPGGIPGEEDMEL